MPKKCYCKGMMRSPCPLDILLDFSTIERIFYFRTQGALPRKMWAIKQPVGVQRLKFVLRSDTNSQLNERLALREKVTDYLLPSVFLTGYFNHSSYLPLNRLFYRQHFSRESPLKGKIPTISCHYSCPVY